MKLSEAKKGARVRLIDSDTGRAVTERLSRLGVHVGDSLKVLNSAPMRGPILVEVQSASSFRVTVGRGMAEKLSVVLFPDE